MTPTEEQQKDLKMAALLNQIAREISELSAHTGLPVKEIMAENGLLFNLANIK